MGHSWIEGGVALGEDPTARIRCPDCKADDLVVRDVYPSPDAEAFERYLECPACKARNVMRKRTGA